MYYIKRKDYKKILAPAFLFAHKAFLSLPCSKGIYSATTLGLVAGQVGMLFTPWGPLVPFMAASSLGFGLGMVQHFRRLTQRTKEYAQFYPAILAHALWVENRIIVPAHIILEQQQQQQQQQQNHGTAANALADNDNNNNNNNPMVEWVTNQGLRHLCTCALATQSCQQDVEEIDKQERQRLMDATLARLAAKDAEDE